MRNMIAPHNVRYTVSFSASAEQFYPISLIVLAVPTYKATVRMVFSTINFVGLHNISKTLLKKSPNALNAETIGKQQIQLHS